MLTGRDAGTWLPDWFAFEPAFRGGVRLTAVPGVAPGGGDLIVLSAGPGGGPVVATYAADGTPVSRFLAGPAEDRGGVTVAPFPAGDPARGGRYELLTYEDTGPAAWGVYLPDGSPLASFPVGPPGADASAVRPVPAGLGVETPGGYGPVLWADTPAGPRAYTADGVRVA